MASSKSTAKSRQNSSTDAVVVVEAEERFRTWKRALVQYVSKGAAGKSTVPDCTFVDANHANFDAGFGSRADDADDDDDEAVSHFPVERRSLAADVFP